MFKNKIQLLNKAKKLIGKSFSDLNFVKARGNKGAAGHQVEKYFGIAANSRSEADIAHLGIEIKIVPLKIRKKDKILVSKERMKLTSINYLLAHPEELKSSHLFQKTKTILVIMYVDLKDKSLPWTSNYFIDVFYWNPWKEETLQFEKDYKIITSHINKSQANILSEKLTKYLVAHTTGQNSKKTKRQKSGLKVKQRAFGFKQGYINMLIQSRHLDPINIYFDDITNKKINYLCSQIEGLTLSQISKKYNVKSYDKSKNKIQMIMSQVFKQLNINKKDLGITFANIRVNLNEKINEHLSLSQHKTNFMTIYNESWKNSKWKTIMEHKKFGFFIFREIKPKIYAFAKYTYYEIGKKDLIEFEKVYTKYRKVLKSGVQTRLGKNNITRNNFPSAKENKMFHIRPKGKDSNDTWKLPKSSSEGHSHLTKQTFWINKDWILKNIVMNQWYNHYNILRGNMKKNNEHQINRQIRKIYKESDNNKDKIAEEFARLLTSLTSIKLKTTDKGPDVGIDGFYWTTSSSYATFYQFKFRYEPGSKNERKEDIMVHVEKMKAFLKNENNKKTPKKLEDLKYNISVGKIKNINIYYITAFEIPRDFNSDLTMTTMTVNNNEIKLSFKYIGWSDIPEFVDNLWIDKDYITGAQGITGKIEIDKSNYIEADGTHLTFLNAKQIIDFIALFSETKTANMDAIDKLTHKNVRDFLGYDQKKTEISTSMANTFSIKNESKINHFFHMGIIIIADKIDKKNIKKTNKIILDVESPSVVNGAQTIGTLIAVEKNTNTKLVHDTKFFVRLIEANNEKNKDLSAKVVLYSNTSRPVNDKMKYAFDEKQSLLAAHFSNYGIVYKYRAHSGARTKNLGMQVKDKAKTLRTDKIEIVKKVAKKQIEPLFLAQVMSSFYKMGKTSDSYNKPNLFRFNPILSQYNKKNEERYNKAFFDYSETNKKWVPRKNVYEYIIPIWFVREIEEYTKNWFGSNTKTVISDETGVVKLTKGDAKKLKWVFLEMFVEELKSFYNLGSIDDLIKKLENEIIDDSKHEEITNKIDHFIREQETDLARSGQTEKQKSQLKKSIIEKNNIQNTAKSFDLN